MWIWRVIYGQSNIFLRHTSMSNIYQYVAIHLEAKFCLNNNNQYIVASKINNCNIYNAIYCNPIYFYLALTRTTWAPRYNHSCYIHRCVYRRRWTTYSMTRESSDLSLLLPHRNASDYTYILWIFIGDFLIWGSRGSRNIPFWVRRSGGLL